MILSRKKSRREPGEEKQRIPTMKTKAKEALYDSHF